jgi:hypothetical protein
MIVTKIGQEFTVSLSTKNLRENDLFKENVIYICTNIVDFDNDIESEVYVGDIWIDQNLTNVVND